MFSVLGLGVVVMPVCLATFSFFFMSRFTDCFSRFVSLSLFALRCLRTATPPQTAGYTPTTHGSARDRHLISLVGGASQEGGGG